MFYVGENGLGLTDVLLDAGSVAKTKKRKLNWKFPFILIVNYN